MIDETFSAKAPDKRSDRIGVRPKRFWTSTSVVPAEGCFAVHLDNRPVKTPGGDVMTLPSRPLAEHVRTEWETVGEYVEFADMPLTRLAFAAIDRMPEVIDDTVAEVRRYAETDLLAYPADYPAALIAREARAWQPWLDWAAVEGIVLHQNTSLVHTLQPAGSLDRIEALVRAMDAFEQAGLMSAVPLFGSVVLALALSKGAIGGEDAFAASRIGEDFQAETWGRDADAQQRAEQMKKQALSLQKWFGSLRN